MLDQLCSEQNIKKYFDKLSEEIHDIFDVRKVEITNPILNFRLFDSVRNGSARSELLNRISKEEAYQGQILMTPADFLAPYLEACDNKNLTYEESWTVYNKCLFDFKTRFIGFLNNLQREYEELTTELKSLQQFLNKFENQFNDYDYKKLMIEKNELSLNKRMVQQRLTLTHEGSQKKYEAVKASLLCDSRLNFQK